jgi:hypothetical protein
MARRGADTRRDTCSSDASVRRNPRSRYRWRPFWFASLALCYATVPLVHLLGDLSARTAALSEVGAAVFEESARGLSEVRPEIPDEPALRHAGCPVCAIVTSAPNLITSVANTPPDPRPSVLALSRPGFELPAVGIPEGIPHSRAPPASV